MLRNLLAGVIGVICALWLGGLSALFLFVTVLFKHHVTIFHQAAPVLFQIFESYQLVLAGLALIATLSWRIWMKCSLITALFILFTLAAIGAAVNAAVITPRMEKLRLAGDTRSPAFASLHGQSMMVYSTELLLLLGAGGAYVVAVQKNNS